MIEEPRSSLEAHGLCVIERGAFHPPIKYLIMNKISIIVYVRSLVQFWKMNVKFDPIRIILTKGLPIIFNFVWLFFLQFFGSIYKDRQDKNNIAKRVIYIYIAEHLKENLCTPYIKTPINTPFNWWVPPKSIKTNHQNQIHHQKSTPNPQTTLETKV